MSSARSKVSACILASCMVGALAMVPGGASAARPVAHIAVACHFHGTEQEHLGPSYVTSLNVHGTSCANGKRVVQAYYNCRVRSGGVKGTCHHSVLGYYCTEHRQGISIQFDASVSCVNGSRRVNHTYTQNT